MRDRNTMIKPGTFSVTVNADARRAEFDIKNEVLYVNEVPVDFVFIGDSIIHMWELNAYFGRSGKIIINRGISGDTSEYVSKRFMADVIQLHPQYASVGIGANDPWDLENDYWIDRPGKPADAVYGSILGNISAIIGLCREHGQKLVLCSILPTDSIYTSCKKERNELIVRVNRRLQEMCGEGILYVDYHTALADSDGITLKQGISDDGVHPRSLGYNIMAGILRDTLQKHAIEI